MTGAMMDPVVNLEAERQVLGSMLLVTADRVRAVQVDTGLRADHFYFDRHRLIWDAVLAVAGEADPDVLLVIAELDRRGVLEKAGGKNHLFELASAPGAVGNVLHHVQVVIEAADWRAKQHASVLIRQGVEERDRGKIGEAEAILGREIVHVGSTFNPAALQVVARRLAADGGAESFRWPFDRLNQFVSGGMRRGEFVVIAGHTAHGKALALDTPIPTPDGWTTMGDLRAGDQVFDQDGKPCRVLRATEPMLNRECFEVCFSDGSTLVADADHQWETWDALARLSESAARRRARNGQVGSTQGHKRTLPGVRTTREILDTLRYGLGSTVERTNHSIPVAGALEYPEKDQPIDPYLFGAWLGDGTSRAAALTCHEQDLDHFVEQIENTGEKCTVSPGETAFTIRFGQLVTCHRGHEKEEGKRCAECHRISVRAHSRGVPSVDVAPHTHFPAVVRLRQLGVLENKHIPTVYMQGSVGQRFALLQGVMDTDGTVSTRGKCEIVVCNERLARDVLELALGLGFRATLTNRPAKLNGRVCGTAWRVGFVTTAKVCRLARKAERIPERASKAGHRYIVDVKPVESVPVKCIQVDSERSLYLAGREGIATHNTVWLDQTLDHLFVQGLKAQLYLTEMTIEERVARTMSRNTGIPFGRIVEGRMSEGEATRYEAGLEKALRIGMTDATGWSVEEITTHIRSNRWDVAAVDTVHDIPHKDTEDLQHIARTLATCSRQAECALLGVVHLNRSRVKTAQAPRPTRNDILGSGAFAQTANTICFVYRQETKNGIPTTKGWIYFAKVRNGRLGEIEVRLDPERFRFEEERPDGDPGPTPPNEMAEKEPVEQALPF